MLRRLFALENLLNLLLVFVPVAVLLHFLHVPGAWVFSVSCLGIIPLAGLMGKATERLAENLGEGIGGLLNATFGNAAELIIATMALRAGLHDVVKASITGSIIGNMLSVVALVMPAIFHMIVGNGGNEGGLSLEISVVLVVTYALSILFTLRTHRHLYTGAGGATGHAAGGPSWVWSLGTLLVATALIAVLSELLVETIDEAARQFGMNEVFVGVVLVALIGNAAEHSTAVLVAHKNKMDLAVNVAVGSSIQIALLIAPLLVFLSYFVGPSPMDLRFTTMEVVAIGMSVLVIAQISQDGETNWMEGVQLLAVYCILGMAFFFLPS